MPDGSTESDSASIRTAPPTATPAFILCRALPFCWANGATGGSGCPTTAAPGGGDCGGERRGQKQLALAVAENQEPFIWLRCGASIAEQLASYGRWLDLHPSYHQMTVEDRVQLVKLELESETERLLVFDNCDDENVVQTAAAPW
ncbi:MAG: hypothetical protein R3C62_06960 [Chloroflexota bacterium]